MSQQRPRRQSIIPLPVPSHLNSSDEDEKNGIGSDIEIIESDHDQVIKVK